MSIVYYDKDGLEEIKGKTKNLIIKIDSNLISTHKITNKNLSLSQAKKSVPFNLEDELLDDIENMEFFIKKNGIIFNIIAIKKQILLDLKNTIKEKKLHIIGAYAEFMFLPSKQDKVIYAKAGNDIIFRFDKYQGGKLNKDLFFTKFNQNDLEETKNRSIDYNIINFLRYDINEIYARFIKPWFGIILLMLLILILKISFLTIENNERKSKLIVLQQNNEKLFKSMFPNITKIVDIKAQSTQQMSNLSAQKQLNNDDFLTAFLKKDLTNKKLHSITFDKILKLK